MIPSPAGRAGVLALVASLALAMPAAPVSASGSGTFEDPLVVDTLPTTITRQLAHPSSTSAGPSCHSSGPGFMFAASVTLGQSTWLAVDTGGSDFDTVLEIRAGNGNQIVTAVPTCVDDTAEAGGQTSQWAGSLAAGSYRIAVSSYTMVPSGTTVHMQLTITDRQLVSATIDEAQLAGYPLAGTVTCHPGTISVAPTITATIDGTALNATTFGGCTADGSTRWFTEGPTAARPRAYKVTTTVEVRNNYVFGPILGYATTTVSARVKTR
jgi:hypothetical protein